MPPRSIHPVLKSPPVGFKLLTFGGCSTICISDDRRTVLKQSTQFQEGPEVTKIHLFSVKESATFLEREIAIYRHLGAHPDILPVLKFRDDGILFPFMKNGALRDHLKSQTKPSRAERQAWIKSALRSLVFVHSRGVLVADISARNFLVTDDKSSILLSDFSGSGLGELESMIRPEQRYERFGANGAMDDISMSTEVFAIGSLIFEIATGKAPYAELDNAQVEETIAKREFPPTDDILCGSVVTGCWEGRYASSAEVLQAASEQMPTDASEIGSSDAHASVN